MELVFKNMSASLARMSSSRLSRDCQNFCEVPSVTCTVKFTYVSRSPPLLLECLETNFNKHSITKELMSCSFI